MKIVIFGIANKNSIKKYKNVAKKTILQYCKNKNFDNSQTLNLIFVDDTYIKKLNHKFLGRNRPTDVIAFPIENNETTDFTDSHRFSFNPLNPSNPWLNSKLWAEIYISIDRAREQAKEYKITPDQEICNLIRHGVLHLLGYTHKQMQKLKD